ncbi:MAG: hypothetical protein KF732_02240 [Flavobacteriales bacterium]|nr:hypothetical protein [Flavobacteriales bacterium]
MIWKILNNTILGVLMLIAGLGTFYKHISFGLGLGDMLGYIALYISVLIHLILTIKARTNTRRAFLALLFGAILVFGCLKATVFRGHEYQWNGSIFYLPCSTEIEIKNEKKTTTKLVSMCTGDYFSEFKAEWDGKFMIIIEGELKIPEDLKEHLNFPISKVSICPTHPNSNYNNEIIYNYDIDTLKMNSIYEIYGNIESINNHTPLIKASIKELKNG